MILITLFERERKTKLSMVWHFWGVLFSWLFPCLQYQVPVLIDNGEEWSIEYLVHVSIIYCLPSLEIVLLLNTLIHQHKQIKKQHIRNSNWIVFTQHVQQVRLSYVNREKYNTIIVMLQGSSLIWYSYFKKTVMQPFTFLHLAKWIYLLLVRYLYTD